MYSTAFWCLFVVLLFFWLYCVTTVTPFMERSMNTVFTITDMREKKLVPSHESEALQDKQILQMKTAQV